MGGRQEGREEDRSAMGWTCMHRHTKRDTGQCFTHLHVHERVDDDGDEEVEEDEDHEEDEEEPEDEAGNVVPPLEVDEGVEDAVVVDEDLEAGKHGLGDGGELDGDEGRWKDGMIREINIGTILTTFMTRREGKIERGIE